MTVFAHGVSACTHQQDESRKTWDIRFGDWPREPLSVCELEKLSQTGLQKHGVNPWSLLELWRVVKSGHTEEASADSGFGAGGASYLLQVPNDQGLLDFVFVLRANCSRVDAACDTGTRKYPRCAIQPLATSISAADLWASITTAPIEPPIPP
jgi:hypothetical protein